MKEFKVVGVMSGTSLDGLDLALCSFMLVKQVWQYRILKAVTIAYSPEWKKKLGNAMNLSGRDLVGLDIEYGRFIGLQVKHFIQDLHEKIDLVSSHGHTIFHEPAKGISKQIGHGAEIAAQCRITTVYDFRTLDIAVGGQGAPLVPSGDELLFGDYGYCLNLGGFSNISYAYKKQRIAFDICPVNTLLNPIAQKLGNEFDPGGMIGKSGKVQSTLLQELNSIPFYHQPPPKSLGREWIVQFVQPILEKHNISPEDMLRTCYEHISEQIIKSFSNRGRKKVLVTGGGACNNFLIDLVRSKTLHHIFVPDSTLIHFKEALIFAFLGMLRIREQANCNSSVTGGKFDTCCGSVQVMI